MKKEYIEKTISEYLKSYFELISKQEREVYLM